MHNIDLEKMASLTKSLGYCVPKVILISWSCGWLDQKQLVGYAQDRLVKLGDRTPEEWVQIAASFEETREQREFITKIVSDLVGKFSKEIPLIKEIIRIYFLDIAVKTEWSNDEDFFSLIEEIRAEFNYPDDMRFIAETSIWTKNSEEEREWMSKSPIDEARRLIDRLKRKLMKSKTMKSGDSLPI